MLSNALKIVNGGLSTLGRMDPRTAMIVQVVTGVAVAVVEAVIEAQRRGGESGQRKAP